MKKPQKIEFEGPQVLPSGFIAIDTGDLWHAEMPRAFWTAEARQLFRSATDAGIVQYIWEAGTYSRGPGITKAQLAYWCKKASTYLGIDRGNTTNWKPFEQVFGGPGCNPLKATLHNITDDLTGSHSTEDYTAAIDNFFRQLEASTNEK